MFSVIAQGGNMFQLKWLSFLASLVLLVGSFGCFVKKEDSRSSSEGSNAAYSYTAGTDGGATIAPTRGNMNKGDMPVFTISLSSGRRIDTVLCWVGGSLVRNSDGTYRFTLAPAERDENIFVRTLSNSGGIVLADAEGAVKRPDESEEGGYVFSGLSQKSIHSVRFLPEYVKEDGAIVTAWRVVLLGKEGTDLPYTITLSMKGAIPRIHILTFVSPGKYELLLPNGSFGEGMRMVLSGGDDKEREEFIVTQ